MNSPHPPPPVLISAERQGHRQILLQRLLALPCSAAAGLDPNREILASLLAGRLVGQGCLPADFGLGPATMQALLDEFFTGLVVAPAVPQDWRKDLPEWEDLLQLLLDHRAGERPSESWLAAIVATACVGREHLWRDLGLASRDELSRLMRLDFPALAAANDRDMKWKKFLYRQFCAAEGIYVCPAPSCAECADYSRCFAPEV